uniref:4HBT domain-containing protein n=1 Tax=Steinernema glaseri TaxID=37863 RepID=A0A1I7YVF9_9BILA
MTLYRLRRSAVRPPDATKSVRSHFVLLRACKRSRAADAMENGCASHGDDNLAFLQKMLDDYKGQDNFNRVARKVTAVSATDQRIVVELTVEHEHVNGKGTLHGGQTASLVDIVTARAVGMTVRDRGMVSVELAVSYLLPVKLGETILIEGIVLKCGRNIAFTECEFRRKTDGALVAKGKHTLAFMHKPVANQF